MNTNAQYESMRLEIAQLKRERDEALQRLAAAEAWVADLQSGMYVNCVYCGHRYGPREGTPVAMADVLKEHIEQCPQHPLSAMKARLAVANADIDRLNQMLRTTGYGQGQIDSYSAECEARERAEERLAAAEARLRKYEPELVVERRVIGEDGVVRVLPGSAKGGRDE